MIITKIAKFGGTSMADAAAVNKSAAVVAGDPSRRIVVVSAPGKRFAGDEKITDLLYKCNALAGTPQLAETFGAVAERFRGIVRDLKLDLDIDKHLNKILADIGSFAGADYAASRGEYLSAIIMAARLGVEFIDAAEIVKFREDGSFDAEFTNDIAGARLARIVRGAVVPGFYGSLPDGGIKTFSRGGGDITGSVIARAAGAGLYENWTDVNGFLTCDPKIVKNPRPIEE
ncbi:MAG: aspartate kinase, partial [Clostridiales bacterium]|nr:aspartate kinase [Clostridiales bacterium]